MGKAGSIHMLKKGAHRGESRAPRAASITSSGENATWTAEISGAFRHHAQSPADFPAVGDWVALEPCAGERKGGHSRPYCHGGAHLSARQPGTVTEAQVAAANVDAVFLVAGLDGDYNVRRIERYLAAAYESGAAPVIVLNKADLCGDIAQIVEEVQAIAFGVPVFAVSAVEEDGAESLRPFAVSGQTVAFLGSSGVGKSSLINALLGEARQQVSEVRADDSRGRHTTTHRELIPVPGGGVLLDTPGMRELQLVGHGRRPRTCVCRYRGLGGRLPFPGLHPCQRARLRGPGGSRYWRAR